MTTQAEASTWFGSPTQALSLEYNDKPAEFERLWRAFMTARATLGLVLLLLQSGIYFLATPQSSTPLLICAAYLTAALAVRVMPSPQNLGNTVDAQWIRTVGVDMLAFAALQTLQNSSINYAPLFALPVLMVSILGSLLLAMAAAAGVTLLLFAYAAWMSLHTPLDATAHFFQAALTGAGCFAISFIANQLAMRLASVELKAQRSQLAAAVQRQVNELVIESLTEGVLVIDEHHLARAANPAAYLLLGAPNEPAHMPLDLTTRPGWQGLLNVVSMSFAGQTTQQVDLTISHEGQGPRRLQVRTRLTAPLEQDTQGLCVVFLQDQREMQARMRTEKLASMGRMSAAVAHEIRNPLAAIVQANALLAEDLIDPIQKQLSEMVQQNAQRLEKIVHDILHLSNSPAKAGQQIGVLMDLIEAVVRICRDWQMQECSAHDLLVTMPEHTHLIWFEPEHLRRIMVNLLDNAQRYASQQSESIQVSTDIASKGMPQLEISMKVWSDGGPLEPSVEQHLFEPFFSSESRSSGLGLYICRELCDSHGASITYDRTSRQMNGLLVAGNEFRITFKTQTANLPAQTNAQRQA